MGWVVGDGSAAILGLSGDCLRSIDDCFSPQLVFYLCTTRPLSRELVDTLYSRRDTLFARRSGEEQPDMVVILDSSGGDIHASYLITRFLRAHCAHLTVVVPRWAKSAATLICLGADELVLTDIAELGPLDPMIRRPGETEWRSVLDEYMGFDALRRETIVSLDLVMPFMISRTSMDVKDLLAPMCQFVSGFMAPVYSRVDPALYGSHTRSLQISKEYAKRVLKQRKLAMRVGTVVADADDIAEAITTSYPSHEFIIDIPELEALGLPVRRVTEKEDKALRPLVRMTGRLDVIGTWSHEQATESIVAAAAEEVPVEDDATLVGTRAVASHRDGEDGAGDAMTGCVDMAGETTQGGVANG